MEKPILCFFAPFVASQQFLKIFNLAGFFCFHQKLASDVKLLKYLAWQFFYSVFLNPNLCIFNLFRPNSKEAILFLNMASVPVGLFYNNFLDFIQSSGWSTFAWRILKKQQQINGPKFLFSPQNQKLIFLRQKSFVWSKK